MDDIKKKIVNNFVNDAPYNWKRIKKEITKNLVNDLLNSLDQFSDPQGKELIDLRNSFQSKLNKKNRRGA